MSLDPPDLDDRTHEELLDDALARLPSHGSAWTDHNPSDPGITILETLAWVAESSIYQLDRVTEQHLRKYLQLLGVQPRPPQPADVWLSVDAPDEPGVEIEAGDRLQAETASGTVQPFAVTDDLVRSPASVATVVARHREGSQTHTRANETAGLHFAAFGEEASTGSALYLGFDGTPFPVGQPLHLHVDYRDEHLAEPAVHGHATPAVEPPAPAAEIDSAGPTAGPDDSESGAATTALDDLLGEPDPTGFEPSVAVDWQYCSDLEYWFEDEHWHSLTVERDETNQLYGGGRVVLALPADLEEPLDESSGRILGVEYPRHWIRCVVTADGYEVPPELNAIRTNVVRASHRTVLEDEPLRRTDGSELTTAHPDQTFAFEHAPVLDASVTVGGERWRAVPELGGSGPGDRHYVLDQSQGVLRFGDGHRGAVPAAGQRVVAESYVAGGGTAGNVPETATWRFLDGDEELSPLGPASGGRDAESVDAALGRLRTDLKRPYRAVTREDVRHVAEHTPGLRFGRTAVRIEDEPDREECASRGTVRVVVVPESTRDRPQPSDGFLDAVERHLQQHRLLADRVAVERPQYVGVGVDAAVELESGTDERRRVEAIEAALRSFLDPLDGGVGDGWPFGRPVYESECYETIASVDGVDCVRDVQLHASGPHDRTGSGVEIPGAALVYSLDHDVEVQRGGDRCGGWNR